MNSESPCLQAGEYVKADSAIAPLTERERHKILAVQEVGGFSLRCISGTTILRSSYQKWRGERIRAERAILKGGKADLPIPVHIQKDMVFWDFMPSDPEVEKLVLIARAFGILQQEMNQKTKKDVIRYRKNSELGEDIVTLASTWEDAVQILELPDCRDDRREVQKQLDELLEQAETDLQKQQLRTRLDAFLTERLRSEFRKIGQDDPRYLQERTIIQEFIAEQKLGSKINLDNSNLNVSPNSYFGFSVPPEDSASKPPTNKSEPVNQLLSQPKFCSQCGNSLIEGDRFCSNCGSPVN
ncbi:MULTISPECIES: zinc ribbon domain-containing protein [unclassified Microcoleus]|uniref:zinc ribbon domain-containing protein n=1 Tax=unclassified Microcoleus TaxID=2642155 RepID=UPI002FD023FF